MTDISEKLKAKLGKLQALAERGIGGEKENASRMLQNLLDKNGLTLDDLETDSLAKHWFKFKGKQQRRILFQIIYSVVGYQRDIWKSSVKRSYIGVSCSPAEQIEIELKSIAYFRAFDDELDLLVSAFVNAHNLFPDDVKVERSSDLSIEERIRRRRMAAIAENLNPVRVNKALPDLT